MAYTEKEITKHLATNLVWKQGFKIVTHQYDNHFGIADVFGVNRNLFTQEFEIKVSKADLMSELVHIEALIKKDPSYGSGEGKYWKHRMYLEAHENGLPKNWRNSYLPNVYSFVVPETLLQLASEKLEGSPYGIVSCKDVPGIYDPSHSKIFFDFVKKPKKIHTEKLDFENLLKISHRLSYVGLNYLSERS